MVDFVKVNIRSCNVTYIEEHPLLNFVGSYYCKTAESIPRKKAHYKGIDFILFDNGLLRLQGSIHKFYNGGLHNYNDFNYTMIKHVLRKLADTFRIDLDEAVISNFEVGANIIPPIDSKSLLDSLLCHKTTSFKDVSRTGGYIKQAEHSQYIVKVYDKGLQYGLKHSCIRFELKFTRMARINQIGVSCLSDLLDINKYKWLKDVVLKEWHNCLLFEFPENGFNLTKKLYQWKDEKYWLSLSKQERYRQRLAYKNYVDSSTQNHHARIKETIAKKFEELSQ